MLRSALDIGYWIFWICMYSTVLFQPNVHRFGSFWKLTSSDGARSIFNRMPSPLLLTFGRKSTVFIILIGAGKMWCSKGER